jgi:hypothetical protein
LSLLLQEKTSVAVSTFVEILVSREQKKVQRMQLSLFLVHQMVDPWFLLLVWTVVACRQQQEEQRSSADDDVNEPRATKQCRAKKLTVANPISFVR